MAVLFDTPERLCRSRNAARDRPVPAPVLTEQLRKAAATVLGEEGWDQVVRVESDEPPAPTASRTPIARPVATGDLVLQVSRFPWGEDPVGWLKDIALAADAAGLGGIALMDHLIQIPQVERAWSPIPEPFTTLGMLAGLDTDLRLGTLCTPVTFRPAGILAKTFATLDVLSGGRAFCGLGAGWWEREHRAFGLPFPAIAERLDQVETTIETMRALWSKGTKRTTGNGSSSRRRRVIHVRSATSRSSSAEVVSVVPSRSWRGSPTDATCRATPTPWPASARSSEGIAQSSAGIPTR